MFNEKNCLIYSLKQYPYAVWPFVGNEKLLMHFILTNNAQFVCIVVKIDNYYFNKVMYV